MMQLSGFRKTLEQNTKTKNQYVKKPITKTIPVEIVDTYSQWRPPHQSTKGENWTFDLFTAPTITKLDDQFDATFPWLQQFTAQSFPLELKTFEKKIYPLQFSGYLLEPNSQNHEYMIILYDHLKKKSLTVKVGDFLEKYNVKIKNFTQNAPSNDAISYIHPEVVLEDFTENIHVTLLPQTVYYNEIFDIIIENSDNKSTIDIDRVGYKFICNDVEFAVKKIDYKFKKLTFECVNKLRNKKFPLEMKVQTQATQKK